MSEHLRDMVKLQVDRKIHRRPGVDLFDLLYVRVETIDQLSSNTSRITSNVALDDAGVKNKKENFSVWGRS